MSTRTLALVGRCGDDGGRYLSPNDWPRMHKRALEMHKAGEPVQVWRAMQNGELLNYDSDATRRLTDYIVKHRED